MKENELEAIESIHPMIDLEFPLRQEKGDRAAFEHRKDRKICLEIEKTQPSMLVKRRYLSKWMIK